MKCKVLAVWNYLNGSSVRPKRWNRWTVILRLKYKHNSKMSLAPSHYPFVSFNLLPAGNSGNFFFWILTGIMLLKVLVCELVVSRWQWHKGLEPEPKSIHYFLRESLCYWKERSQLDSSDVLRDVLFLRSDASSLSCCKPAKF